MLNYLRNIEQMTTSQWLAYRAEQLANHYAKGLTLKPSESCSSCDLDNDYVCLDCELIQIEGCL